MAEAHSLAYEIRFVQDGVPIGPVHYVPNGSVFEAVQQSSHARVGLRISGVYSAGQVTADLQIGLRRGLIPADDGDWQVAGSGSLANLDLGELGALLLAPGLAARLSVGKRLELEVVAVVVH